MDLRTAIVFAAITLVSVIAFHLIARPARKERRFREIEARLNWRQGN